MTANIMHWGDAFYWLMESNQNNHIFAQDTLTLMLTQDHRHHYCDLHTTDSRIRDFEK